MSTITTLRPNSQEFYSGVWTLHGAANRYAATNDNSDGSYISGDSGPGGNLILGLDSFSIPSDSYVRRVRINVRARRATTTEPFMYFTTSVRVGPGIAKPESLPDFYSDLFSGFGVYYGRWMYVTPSGKLWTQDDIDNLQAQLFIKIGGSTYKQVDVAEVYVDVETNKFPTVSSIITPSGTITGTTHPTIKWVYDDDEADVGASYETKIFTDAQYSAGGFDPYTSTPYWLKRASLAMEAGFPYSVVPPHLPNDIYRVYVRVFQLPEGQPSLFNSSNFEIAVTYPTTPDITVTADDVNWRMTIVVDVHTDNCVLTVERSDDGGTTWAAIREGTVAGCNDGDTITVHDYEACPGLAVQYRAHVTITLAGEEIQGEAASDSGTSNPTTAKGWILKDVYNHTLNADFDIFADNWDTVETEEQATYKPLGRRLPVVVSDVIHGSDGQLDIDCVSQEEVANFKALRNLQVVLLLQRAYADIGQQKYIRLGSDLKITEMNTNPVRTQMTITYIEVEMPTI